MANGTGNWYDPETGYGYSSVTQPTSTSVQLPWSTATPSGGSSTQQSYSSQPPAQTTTPTTYTTTSQAPTIQEPSLQEQRFKQQKEHTPKYFREDDPISRAFSSIMQPFVKRLPTHQYSYSDYKKSKPSYIDIIGLTPTALGQAPIKLFGITKKIRTFKSLKDISPLKKIKGKGKFKQTISTVRGEYPRQAFQVETRDLHILGKKIPLKIKRGDIYEAISRLRIKQGKKAAVIISKSKLKKIPGIKEFGIKPLSKYTTTERKLLFGLGKKSEYGYNVALRLEKLTKKGKTTKGEKIAIQMLKKKLNLLTSRELRLAKAKGKKYPYEHYDILTTSKGVRYRKPSGDLKPKYLEYKSEKGLSPTSFSKLKAEIPLKKKVSFSIKSKKGKGIKRYTLTEKRGIQRSNILDELYGSSKAPSLKFKPKIKSRTKLSKQDMKILKKGTKQSIEEHLISQAFKPKLKSKLKSRSTLRSRLKQKESTKQIQKQKPKQKIKPQRKTKLKEKIKQLQKQKQRQRQRQRQKLREKYIGKHHTMRIPTSKKFPTKGTLKLKPLRLSQDKKLTYEKLKKRRKHYVLFTPTMIRAKKRKIYRMYRGTELR